MNPPYLPRTPARLLCCLGLALLAGSCGGPSPRASRVVLITCDTLRADHLGVYGYGEPVSPNLDRFARDAVVFDAAYSSAPMTRPALSSLMTGRYAEEVGAAPGNMRMMSARVETLAERISAAGIATAAVVSNGLIQRSARPNAGEIDLAQGFALYDDKMTARERNREMPERLAPDTTDAALAWLAGHAQAGGGPLFLWVHYQDPHGPYTPPEELVREFERPPAAGQGEEARLPIGRTVRGHEQIPVYQVLPGPSGGAEQRSRIYRERYDAEIAYFDNELERLLAALRADPAWEDTLVILSADHGESLGEREYWFCHGENVQREVVHVPFLVRYPRGMRGPPASERDGYRRVSDVVGHVDVWPTVLEALGLDSSGSRGLALLGERLPRDRVLAQSYLSGSPLYDQWGITDGRWRLVWGGDDSVRLHDLSEDPTEELDVAGAHPEVIERLSTRYQASRRLFEGDAHEGEAMVLDAATQRALRKLGYIDLEPGELEE